MTDEGGEGGNTPYMLILMVVGIALLLLILIKEKDVIFGIVGDGSDCAGEVRAAALTGKYGGDGGRTTIKCPTKAFAAVGDGPAKERIAQSMKSCWDMWGRGELALFENKEGVYCHVCATVTVTETSAVTGLPEYLRSTKATKDQTYAEYLAGVERGSHFSEEDFKDLATSSIPTSSPIGVLFITTKGQDATTKFREGILKSGGFVMGKIGKVGGTIAPFCGVMAPTLAVGSWIMRVTSKVVTVIPSDLDTMSAVAVRPLTSEAVQELGCTQAPVES